MILRVDHRFLRLDCFVLHVHRAELTADDLHRVGNALRLHLALRALLPFDVDFRVLALQLLRRGELP